MVKEILSLMLVFIVLGLAVATPVSAQTTPTKQDKKTQKVKGKIKELGLGEQVIVKVKLYTNTTFQGYVSKANENDFVVVDSTGTSNTVRYSDVDSVSGKNFLSGHKTAVGVTIGVVATLAIIYLIFHATGKRL